MTSSLLILVIAAVVTAITSALRGKLVAVHGGVDAFALYAVAASFIGFGTTAFSLNMGVGIAKKLADNGGNNSVFSSASNLGAILVLGSLPLSVIFFLVIKNLEILSVQDSLIAWVSLGVAFGIASNIVLSLCQGMGKMRGYGAVQVTAGAISVLITLIFSIVRAPDLPGIAALSFPFSFALVSLALPVVRAAIPLIGSIRVALIFASGILKQSLYFTLSGSLQQGATFLWRLVCIYLIGVAESGPVLAAWMALLAIFSLINIPLAKDLLPRMRRELNSGNDAFRREVGKVLQGLALFLSIIWIVVFFFAELLIQLLYSREFLVGVEAVRWLVIAEIARSFYSFFSVCQIACDRERKVLFAELASVAMSVLVFLAAYETSKDFVSSAALAAMAGYSVAGFVAAGGLLKRNSFRLLPIVGSFCAYAFLLSINETEYAGYFLVGLASLQLFIARRFLFAAALGFFIRASELVRQRNSNRRG